MNGKRAKSIRRFIEGSVTAGLIEPAKAKASYKKLKRKHTRGYV